MTPSDGQAWTAATVDKPDSWYYPVPPGCLRHVDDALARFDTASQPATDLRLSGDALAACRESLAAARDALETGRGFVILTGIADGRYSAGELKGVYWLVGQALGDPIEQNVQRTLLYDVRDTGQDLSQGARFSVTSYESSYHTDNSFGDTLADYVGLLCLQVAR